MSDAELVAKVEEVTAARDALAARLAPRKRAEAATLKHLNDRLSAARAEVARHEAQLAKDAAALAAAEAHNAQLKGGLTPGARFWARIGEPVVACLLLVLASFVVVRSSASKPVVLTLLASFAVGGGLFWWRRGPHG